MFRASDLVPKLIFLFLKIVVTYFLAFVFINIFFILNIVYNVSILQERVCSAVELNGFLPEHDYIAINNTIISLQQNELLTDEQIYEGTEGGIPGVNRVLTNLKIAVWDEQGRGRTNINMDKSVMEANSDIDYENAGVDPFYIGKQGLKNKRQQGDILYAGVVFRYHPILPFVPWDYIKPSHASSIQGLIETPSTGGGFESVANKGRKQILDQMNNNEWMIEFSGDTSNSYNHGTFGMKAVPCWQYYPDLTMDSNYS